MSHTYTFTASTADNNLFLGNYRRFYLDDASFDAWGEAEYVASPSQYNIARTNSSGSYPYRYWSCKVCFGKNSSDRSLLDHIHSLPAASIQKITLSFSVYAGRWDRDWYWDTALDSAVPSSTFASEHKNAGLKTASIEDTTVIDHSDGTVELDITDYGVPESYAWLFRSSIASYMYLTSDVVLTIITSENYTLTTSSGTGSSVTVNRTSSPRGGNTGILASGAAIYYGDVLKITFASDANYSITIHTVNGTTFNSGGNHTVTGNVSVVATATPLKSDIAATDANIGSVSNIIVTRYNDSYTHTISYLCGEDSGIIIVKGTATSIPWIVPTSLYAQIPNEKTATVTLTCETFNGESSMGTTSTTITVTAAETSCAPIVSGTVSDDNPDTSMLTGDNSVLVKYKSTACCTISAEAINSATIVNKTINGTNLASGNTMSISGVEVAQFVFTATDSRGYTAKAEVTPSIINYVPLTCTPELYRTSPTGNVIVMDVSGNYYRGSFGRYSNTLRIRYRSKLTSSAVWGSWVDVPAAHIELGENSYSISGETLTGFSYLSEFDFQIQAIDGANDLALSTVTEEITVRRGIPLFDWGDKDFEFHVPLKVSAPADGDAVIQLGNTIITEAQLIMLLDLIT